MTKYYYCVNTFDKNGMAIQLDGYIEAESDRDAIQKLISQGLVDADAYEFLELYDIYEKDDRPYDHIWNMYFDEFEDWKGELPTDDSI